MQEIQHRYGHVEEQINDLRENTDDWELARVERFVGTVGRALSYARSGLANPSDADERFTVSQLVDKLEDIYIEIWVVIQVRRADDTA